MRTVDASVNPVLWEPDDAPEYVRHAIGETFHTLTEQCPPELPEAGDPRYIQIESERTWTIRTHVRRWAGQFYPGSGE